MRPSKPPALATWLLEHIRFSTTDCAIAGDLMEEFTQGRSAAWYWRQVLVAIILGYGNEVRNHWMLAIGAALIGLAVSTGVSILLHSMIATLHEHGMMHSIPRGVPWALTSFLSGIISGWLVAFLHPKNRRTMLLTFAWALLIWSLMGRGFISGSERLVSLLIDYVVVMVGIAAGALITRGTNRATPSRPSRSVV